MTKTASKNAFGACVVLATQRSGSSLLSKYLTYNGGFGRVEEHFLPWLHKQQERMSEEEFKCVVKNAQLGGVFGVKLMANYISRVAKGSLEMPSSTKTDELACDLLEKFSDLFNGCIVIQLKRKNVIDQAISRLLAEETNMWHKDAESGEFISAPNRAAKRSRQEVLTQGRPRRLVKIIGQIDRENEFLDDLCGRTQLRVNKMTYEDLVAEPVEIGKALNASLGMAEDRPWEMPQLLKVTTQDEVAVLRARLAAFLGCDTPSDTDVLLELSRVFLTSKLGGA